MRLPVLIAAALVCAPALAEGQSYLFDVLRQPHFKQSWTQLMKGVQPTPDWLRQFSENFEGTSGDMKPVTIDGKPYLQSFVCEPADCAAHKFEVLFTADGARAFGALGGGEEPPGFYGAPDAAQQEALTKALHPVAAVEPPQAKSE